MKNQLFSHKFLRDQNLLGCGFKSMGENIMIHETANIVGIENISLGSHVRIDAFTTIMATGPVNIGSYVHIGAYCSLTGTGGIEIADFAGLSQGVRLFTRSDDYSGAHLTNPTVPSEFCKVKVGPIILGKHAIIGSNSIVLPNVAIGEGCAVGALSMVTKNLDAWSTYLGVPAKKIKSRKRNLLALEKRMLQS